MREKDGQKSHADGGEYRLVLETLQPLSGDRKAFRLINGVLMEQTVKDVLPALTTNSEGLKKVLEDLVKQYKTKQDELEKWKVCFFFPGKEPSAHFGFLRVGDVIEGLFADGFGVAEEEQCPGCPELRP